MSSYHFVRHGWSLSLRMRRSFWALGRELQQWICELAEEFPHGLATNCGQAEVCCLYFDLPLSLSLSLPTNLYFFLWKSIINYLNTNIWLLKSHVLQTASCLFIFTEKGYCMRGDLCPYDHGSDPVILEDVDPLYNGSGAPTPLMIQSAPPPPQLAPPPPAITQVTTNNMGN